MHAGRASYIGGWLFFCAVFHSRDTRLPHTSSMSVCRFGGNEGHDPHILYTLSALQVMALLGELERVDKDKV